VGEEVGVVDGETEDDDDSVELGGCGGCGGVEVGTRSSSSSKLSS